MNFIFSKHAEEQMVRRSLKRSVVEAVFLKPEQVLENENDEDIRIYQSIVKEGDILFLYRVFVNTKIQPNVIVTLYKTTKIDKYYES
jgi:DNA repair ATPase RecN